MKKIFFSLVCAFTAAFFISAQAEDKLLSFDEINSKSYMSYVGFSSQSSENPIMFRIENWDNRNIYRFFEGDQPPYAFPKVSDYRGIEIEFDYESFYEIPGDIQLYLSTNGFVSGTYPNIVYELSGRFVEGTTTLVFNFADLTVLDQAGTFNRFGIRYDGTPGNRKADCPSGSTYDGTSACFEYFPYVDVKIKHAYLINWDDSKVAFEYRGGGMYNAQHSYRLYGTRADIQLEGGGYATWDLSAETVEYINIYLAAPLSASAASDLEIDYQQFTAVPAKLIKGLSAGSQVISLDLRTLDVRELTFYTDITTIELPIDRIALSAAPASFKNVVSDKLPAFVNVYNITGKILKQNVARESALEGLEKGVYIVNNTKVVIY